MRGAAARHALAAIIALATAGCATGGASVADVRELAGVWEGWLVSANDMRPAVLAIMGNGSFALESGITVASGEIVLAGHTLLFEGGNVWHGTLTAGGDANRRTLVLERADRGFRGRFTRKPD